MIINPGGFTHTSVALRDALVELEDHHGFIEVHISNVHAREPLRAHSYLSPIAKGVIAGLGVDGYRLALDGGKLVAMNAAGRPLAAVPKELRAGETAARLLALRDWLAEHDRACAAAVERWMLRSLPVPRAVLQAVWDDAGWRAALENAVIAPVGEAGGRDADRVGEQVPRREHPAEQQGAGQGEAKGVEPGGVIEA